VATLAGASDLLKASFAESFDKSHEAIARGIRIDRIGLNDRSAITRGMLDRRAKNLVHKPLSTKFALDEEAGQRPNCFGGCSLHASEGAIRGSRSDRAPSHGCAVTIAENPDRHAGVDSGFHRCAAVCAVGLFCPAAVDRQTIHQQLFGPPRLSKRLTKSDQVSRSTSRKTTSSISEIPNSDPAPDWSPEAAG
jgi:hypothetical protein